MNTTLTESAELLDTFEPSASSYVEFNDLSTLGFHINSAVAVIGFFASLFMFFHALYAWCHCCEEQTKQKKKATLSIKIIASSITVLILSVLLFGIYCIEFFYLRLFPPTTHNYSAFVFCKGFSPFLFLSAIVLMYAVIHYFLIRLQTSFEDSHLAYSKWFYFTLRVFFFCALLLAAVLVIVATDGLPFNVPTSQVTNDDPWLCRHGVLMEYRFFWRSMNVFALLVVLGGHWLNWYLYVNRFGKLFEMMLSTDDTFIAHYTQAQSQGTPIRTRIRTDTEVSESSQTQQSSVPVSSSRRVSPASGVGGLAINVEMQPIAEQRSTHVGYPDNVVDTPIETPIDDDSVTAPSMHMPDSQKSKWKQHEEHRLKRKKRRSQRERSLYRVVKRISILTGVVCTLNVVLWTFQITVDEGSTMLLLSTLSSTICVYLSFNFKIKCFDLCCSRCMDDCTCIEDRMEKKVAQKMGLRQQQYNEEEMIDLNGPETQS